MTITYIISITPNRGIDFLHLADIQMFPFHAVCRKRRHRGGKASIGRDDRDGSSGRDSGGGEGGDSGGWGGHRGYSGSGGVMRPNPVKRPVAEEICGGWLFFGRVLISLQEQNQ